MKKNLEIAKNFIKRNKILLVILSLIIITSFAIRVWHFSDWLYFNLDQARDAELARESLEKGPEYLPLLGPRAAGTYLRMGPVYYYFQYSSAKIINTLEPYALAVPDLFFSILSIPLFYYLLRIFVSSRAALITTALYSFSFLSIQYSRFAWNTNSLPFWTALLALSIYKTVSVKDKIKRGRWLVLTAASFGILSQLHFVALGGFGLIGLVFLLAYKPKINLKYWVYAASSVFVLYIPMILSEIKTKGANFEQFKYALFAKTSEGPSFIFSLVEATRELSRTFVMFLTSFGESNEELYAWVGFVFIFSGLLLLARKAKKNKSVRAISIIVFIWLFVFIIVYAKTDTSLKPRFFLPLMFIPFLFFSLMIEKIITNYKNKGLFFVIIIAAVFVATNANAVFMWYNYLDSSKQSSLKREIFLKQTDGITAGQMKEATKFMTDKALEKDKNLCYRAPAARIHGYKYYMLMSLPEEKIHRIKHRMDNKKDCVFFSVSQIDDESPIDREYSDDFSFVRKHVFGRVAVWDIEPNELFMRWEEIEEDKKEKKEDKKEIEDDDKKEKDKEVSSQSEKQQEEVKDLKDTSSQKQEDIEEEKEEIIEKPDRHERILWKGVFE
ncbi:MAG: glycosyltransferase family 39 protein [Candidatus Moraniibacteriota bacterium]